MTILDAKPTTTVSKWRPNEGPQEFALRQPSTVKEILYGGQRGGGKTDAGMVWVGQRRWRDGDTLKPVYEHPKYRALVIRKNADDLSDWIERFRFMYAGTGAKVGYRPYEIRFPSGAFIRTGHLKDEQAYTKYQGHEYQSVLTEELTQIPSEKRYAQLISSCRSTVPELKPQIFNTTNPGGLGHMWVKGRFVDPAPPRSVFIDEDGNTRIYIPAGIEDNPVLTQNDPGYVKQLEALKRIDPDLYKAWREGSWDVVAGQVFREFSQEHHVSDKAEFSLEVCEKIIAFDWGFTHKAVAHWLALTPENAMGFRRVYLYRELAQNKTNPEEWARMIKRFTDVEKVRGIILPHDCFAQKLSKVTIAKVFERDIGISVIRGDTLSAGARLNRKAILHRYLADAPDGRPYMIVHPSCRELINTLPTLQYDEKNVEDVAKQDGDDAYDACSLGLISLNYWPEKSAILRPKQSFQTYPTWQSNKYGSIPSPNFWEAFDKAKFKKKRDAEYL